MRQDGCLPRESRVGQYCPTFGSRIKLIPRKLWADYAGKISMRPFVEQVYSQGSVGSCAAESSVQAMAIARAVAGDPYVEFNPYFVYHTTSRGRDAGSSIDANLRFLRDKGCAPADVWGRDKGWRTAPPELVWRAAKKYRIMEFYDITDVDEMVTALLKGFPVVYGAKGHAVCKVAHLDAKQGLDVNSWGVRWGDKGFGVWADYNSVGWNYGAFAVRTATMSDKVMEELSNE